MNKLTGHGRPHNRLIGEVGQHYEDLNTGDLYECRVASQWSPTHGWPVGGYVWERRAKGEDIREIYGGSGGSNVYFVVKYNNEVKFVSDGIYDAAINMFINHIPIDIVLWGGTDEGYSKYILDTMYQDADGIIWGYAGNAYRYEIHPDGSADFYYYD